MSRHFDLLTVDANPKIMKGDGRKTGYLTAVLHLLPNTTSMQHGGLGLNTCPWADGCERSCLNTAGLGRFDRTQDARRRKTLLFASARELFMDMLVHDIHRFVEYAKFRKLKPAVRLNGTSDILWDRVQFQSEKNVMAFFPDVQFYDYTKRPLGLAENLPKNYHLTFSRGASTADSEVRATLALGLNVAILYDTKKGQPLPECFYGYRIIDGDKNDLRFLDPKGVVVGLRAKGKAKQEENGFVVKTQYEMLRLSAGDPNKINLSRFKSSR